MAWTAIVARPSCAKGPTLVCKGIRPSLLTSFVVTPESAFADSLERFRIPGPLL